MEDFDWKECIQYVSVMLIIDIIDRKYYIGAKPAQIIAPLSTYHGF